MDLPNIIQGRDPTAEEIEYALQQNLIYKRKYVGSGVIVWELKSKKCCCKG